MLIVLLAIHVVAHVFNVEFFIMSWREKDHLFTKLNQLEDGENSTYLNPIRLGENAVSLF